MKKLIAALIIILAPAADKKQLNYNQIKTT